MPQSMFFSGVAIPMVLAAPIDSNPASDPVVNLVTGLPSGYPFEITVDLGIYSGTELIQEAMLVTSAPVNNGNGTWTLPVTRGIDGTTIQPHSANATVTHTVLAQDHNGYALHLGSSTAVHGLETGSAVVGTLDTQTLSGKTLYGAVVSADPTTPMGVADKEYVDAVKAGAAQLGSANIFLGNQYIKGGSPWYDVVAFGADPTGVNDSTAAFNAAILAATGTAAPATNSRYATGPVFMPSGTFKISSDLLIQSTLGFQLIGSGEECTFIEASGTGFTTAVINIDGSYHGHYGGFTLKGDGTEQVPNGINLTYTTAAQRSTTANTLEHINIRNLKFVAGLSLAGVSTRQLDGTQLIDIVITGGQTAGSWSTSGNWQYGVIFGNGSFGNIYDQVCRGVSVAECYYGYYCNASSFALYGAQPASNAVDFFIIPSAQCTISNVQSQNSGQFITQTSAFSPIPVSVSDCEFVTTYATTANFINVYGGMWDIHNVTCVTFSGTGITVPVINVQGAGAGRPGVVSLANVTLSNTFPACIGVAGSGYPNALVMRNLVYYNAGAYTTYPQSVYLGTSGWETLLSGFSTTASLAFTSAIATGATASKTMTVTGAVAGMAVSVGVPSTFNAGLIAYGFVSAANTVTVVIANLSGASVTPGTISVTAEVH